MDSICYCETSRLEIEAPRFTINAKGEHDAPICQDIKQSDFHCSAGICFYQRLRRNRAQGNACRMPDRVQVTLWQDAG
jgi:hypothetical protein